MPTKVDFEKIRSTFFFVVVIGLVLGLLYVLRPFFYPIFWAGISAIMFYPWYSFINKHVKQESVSAFISVILVVVTLFVPLVLIGIIVYYQSLEIYNAVAQGLVNKNIANLGQWFTGTQWAGYASAITDHWNEYAVTATQNVSIYLFQNLQEITRNLAWLFFQITLMLYTLYFFFKDGIRLLKFIRRISPLENEYDDLLFGHFTSTARATLKGSLIMGGIQGLLGGLLFTVTGVSGAIIWGVLLMICSLIPGIGLVVVWLPTALIMLLTGHAWQALTIFAVGVFVFGTIDSVLRPPLVGKDSEMHPVIVLFSTLGGIFTFGISGFVIGPIIAAMCLSSISIYTDYYKKELDYHAEL